MINLDDVPDPRASVVIPTGSPLITFTDGGAIYDGPCPAASHGQVHLVTIARNAAKCGVCGTEFTAQIIRPLLAAAYLRLQF